MSHKILKLLVDNYNISFDYGNGINEEYQGDDEKIVLQNLPDNYDYIILIISDGQTEKLDYIKKQIWDNGNYKCVYDWEIMGSIIFTNIKITECRFYIKYTISCKIFDMTLNRRCDIHEIICPCVIKSFNDITQYEEFVNLKFERLTHDPYYIYFATKRETMTKSIQIKNK